VLKSITSKLAGLEIEQSLTHSYLRDLHGTITASVANLAGRADGTSAALDALRVLVALRGRASSQLLGLVVAEAQRLADAFSVLQARVEGLEGHLAAGRCLPPGPSAGPSTAVALAGAPAIDAAGLAAEVPMTALGARNGSAVHLSVAVPSVHHSRPALAAFLSSAPLADAWAAFQRVIGDSGALAAGSNVSGAAAAHAGGAGGEPRLLFDSPALPRDSESAAGLLPTAAALQRAMDGRQAGAADTALQEALAPAQPSAELLGGLARCVAAAAALGHVSAASECVVLFQAAQREAPPAMPAHPAAAAVFEPAAAPLSQEGATLLVAAELMQESTRAAAAAAAARDAAAGAAGDRRSGGSVPAAAALPQLSAAASHWQLFGQPGGGVEMGAVLALGAALLACTCLSSACTAALLWWCVLRERGAAHHVLVAAAAPPRAVAHQASPVPPPSPGSQSACPRTHTRGGESLSPLPCATSPPFAASTRLQVADGLRSPVSRPPAAAAAHSAHAAAAAFPLSPDHGDVVDASASSVSGRRRQLANGPWAAPPAGGKTSTRLAALGSLVR
jgi:hypothetical protein